LFKFIRKNVPYSCCSVDEGGLVGYSLAFLSTEQDKIWIAQYKVQATNNQRTTSPDTPKTKQELTTDIICWKKVVQTSHKHLGALKVMYIDLLQLTLK
jgi:hypothetical protein